MLDEILNLVREHAPKAIDQNPAIPNELNQQTAEATGHGIAQFLQNKAGQGGLSALTNLLGGDGQHEMVTHVAQFVSQKVGISASAAQTAVAAIVPMILSKVGHGSAGNLSLESIMAALGGGGKSRSENGQSAEQGGLGGLLGKIF